MSKETTCNAAFKTIWSWVGACEILGRCAHPQNCLDIWIGGVKIKHTGQSTHLTEIIIHFNICTCTHHKKYVCTLFAMHMPNALSFAVWSLLYGSSDPCSPSQPERFFLAFYKHRRWSHTLTSALRHDCRAECSPGDFGGSKFGSCTVCVVWYL